MKLQESTDADRSMLNITVTSNGIEKLLSNLNPHKAAGPKQPFDPTITNPKISLPKVARLGNLTTNLEGCSCGACLQKGERSNPANYRPISLTCILCKTLEHIVASSTTKHLSKLNIFYELQHGFREKRSSESQLLMLVDDLFISVYKKKPTDLILLDFSKAFDKVSHEKLALKLHDYGIRGPALKWVKGVLNNRHQFVIVNGSSSEPIPVSSRVPQRYVLRPLLFLIYINDYPQNVKSEMRLFADNTAL